MVDVDALDGFHLCLDEFWQLLKQKEHVGFVGIATSGLHHLVVALCLTRKNLEETACLCFHLGIGRIGFTLGIDTNLFSLGFCLDNFTFLLNFLADEHVGTLCGAFTVCTCFLGFLFCRICFFACLGCCHFLGCYCLALCFCLTFATVCIRIGNLHLCFVFTLHGLCIGFSGTDTGLSVGIGLTDFTEFLLFCHAYLGFVDGLGCRFLSECLNVAALIVDVGYVHVDESQTNFLQFHLDVAGDGFQELVTVA